VTELLCIALRAVGVVLPGGVVIGVVELRGGPPEGDFGTYLGAMALSLLAAAVWAGVDSRRTSAGRVVARWSVTAAVVGAGIAGTTTALWPGSPPGAARVEEAVTMSLFYVVPLLAAAVTGAAVGAATGSSRSGVGP